jgi:hypothetical protein
MSFLIDPRGWNETDSSPVDEMHSSVRALVVREIQSCQGALLTNSKSIFVGASLSGVAAL